MEASKIIPGYVVKYKPIVNGEVTIDQKHIFVGTDTELPVLNGNAVNQVSAKIKCAAVPYLTSPQQFTINAKHIIVMAFGCDNDFSQVKHNQGANVNGGVSVSNIQYCLIVPNVNTIEKNVSYVKKQAGFHFLTGNLLNFQSLAQSGSHINISDIDYTDFICDPETYLLMCGVTAGEGSTVYVYWLEFN